MQHLKSLCDKYLGGRTRFFFSIIIIYLLFQQVIRALLFFHTGNLASLDPISIIKTFAVGFIYDVVIILQALIPLFIIFMILPTKWFKNKVIRFILSGIIFFMFFLMVFIGISEYCFWDEFQTKFNFIAVDYLIYTTEVLGNISQAYNLWLLIPLILLLTLMLTVWQKKFLDYNFAPLSIKHRLLGLFLTILVPFFFYNTVDSKMRNYASDNKYNIEIAGNGPYEFVSAFCNNELDYYSFYITKPDEEILENLRTLVQTSDTTYLDNNSLERRIESNKPLQKPNIVFIVVESFSSDFIGVFGNEDNLTPNIDKLSKESLFFTNVYATGTRTVRGLEALSLSIPPTPGQSILRRPNHKDLFTMGHILEQEGYKSSFIYGGYGYFDNMNSFFEANGYSIIDRTDIPKEEIFFETSWGVADEILFDQAIKEMDASFANNEKSFQFITTTSNHSPFTYPEDRIEIPVGKRNGAVKYTDWAIGNFIEKAKTKPWFEDTIFIIVADHQANSAGRVDLPVNKYHIPLLFYAPKYFQPEVNNRLMSQIDIPPTLLGFLGYSYNSKFLGYDINKIESDKERVFVSTYQNLGYIKKDTLVILKPQKQVVTYKINDFATSDYTLIENNDLLTNEAITWYQGASYLYKNMFLNNKNN